MNGNLLNEKVRKLIGRRLITQEGKILPVDKTAIQRYCESCGNLNPLYLDDEYAKSGPYGEIVAPPTFFWVPFRACAGEFLPVPQGTDTPDIAELKELFELWLGFDGEEEMEFFAPVRLGDTLTYDREVVDVTEKKLKSGPALFITIRMIVTNQKGELVCIDTLRIFLWR